jgi:hypothetical protein
MTRWGLLFLGCSAVWAPSAAHAPDMVMASLPPPAKRVTDRPGNVGGKIPVLMYHRIGEKEAYMVRSRDNFRRDLARLYKMGFRPVTLSEYLENKMKLPGGASPVVLTFDDSMPDQIRLDKNGQVDRSTFVGIWLDFAKKRPDFPVKGTFFANNNGPFGREKQGAKVIGILQGLGSEIGAHTATHKNLAKISPAAGRKEIESNLAYLSARGAKVRTFATPYGVWPKSSLLSEKFGSKKGRARFLGVAAAGSGPAHSPVSSRHNPMVIPRIKAYEGNQGVHWWLDKVKKGRVEVYVQP